MPNCSVAIVTSAETMHEVLRFLNNRANEFILKQGDSWEQLPINGSFKDMSEAFCEWFEYGCGLHCDYMSERTKNRSITECPDVCICDIAGYKALVWELNCYDEVYLANDLNDMIEFFPCGQYGVGITVSTYDNERFGGTYESLEITCSGEKRIYTSNFDDDDCEPAPTERWYFAELDTTFDDGYYISRQELLKDQRSVKWARREDGTLGYFAYLASTILFKID